MSTDAQRLTSSGRRKPRRVNYIVAAIVGGTVWLVIGTMFAERLFMHALTWDEPTQSQLLADYLLIVLFFPFAFILAQIEGKLVISFFLNGALWGLATASVFNTISTWWERRKWRT